MLLHMVPMWCRAIPPYGSLRKQVTQVGADDALGLFERITELSDRRTVLGLEERKDIFSPAMFEHGKVCSFVFRDRRCIRPQPVAVMFEDDESALAQLEQMVADGTPRIPEFSTDSALVDGFAVKDQGMDGSALAHPGSHELELVGVRAVSGLQHVLQDRDAERLLPVGWG